MSFVSHNSCDLNTSSGKEGDKMNELEEDYTKKISLYKNEKKSNDLNFDEDNKSKISNNMKDHNELSPYLFDSKNDKENLARSAKKCLLKSKNVIENTLKETIDDFEQKLGKLEAELDPRNSNRNIFQNERNQSLNSFYLRNNENSLCQMLDQKIDKMFEKIKKPLKFDHFETPEKNSFKKTENPHMKDGFEDETRNKHLSLKTEIRNLSNSLKTTLETFNLKIKKENRINNEEEQKQPLSEKINRIPKNKTLIKESINPPISIENPKSQLDNSKQVKNEKSREPLKKTKGDNLEEEKHYKKPANFINFKEEFKIL